MWICRRISEMHLLYFFIVLVPLDIVEENNEKIE